MAWEFTFLRWIVEHMQTSFLDGVFKAITLLGESGAIFFLISFIMIIFKKTRRAGLVILAGLVIVAGGNNFILKPIIGRARPFLSPNSSDDITFISNYVDGWSTKNGLGEFLRPENDSYSFMSGHTLSAFIFGFGVLTYHPKWSAPALVFAVLMAFSRLYLAVHYPTDVIAGILTASVTILAIYFINHRFENTFIKWWNAFIRLFKKKKPAVAEGEEVDNASDIVETNNTEE